MRKATSAKFFLAQTYFNFWRLNARVLGTRGYKAEDFGANNGGLGIFGGTLTLQIVHTRHDWHCMQRRCGFKLTLAHFPDPCGPETLDGIFIIKYSIEKDIYNFVELMHMLSTCSPHLQWTLVSSPCYSHPLSTYSLHLPAQPHPPTFLFCHCEDINVGTLGAEAPYDLTTATTAGYRALGRLGAATAVGGLGGCCWG